MTVAGLADVPELGPVLSDVSARASDPEQWARFERQLRSAGYCRHPVRPRGETEAVDIESGEVRTVFSTEGEPDGTLLKCCGNRREAVCPSCAEVYRGDAFQLVAAGLRGGKGVPESVAAHPMVFVTFTAPSVGAVHSRRLGPTGEPRRCRPRRDAPVCPHGLPMGCGDVHDEDDPRLGEPLCLECFDHQHEVLWNALAPELWRVTRNQIPRELAREPELRPLRLRRWAHALGFRGHCFTKSRRYSTTFTRLRQARHEHELRRAHGGEPRDPWGRPASQGASVERRRWSFAGSGYRTFGDAWLAESGVSGAGWRVRSIGPACAAGPVEGQRRRRWEAAMSQSRDREQYLTAQEVAARLGLAPSTVLRYYREGRIPGRRMPGSVRPVRFLWSEVDAAWDCERRLTLGDAA